MIHTVGAVINAGIIIYLGLRAKECMSGTETALIQNPLVLSFIAIVALFLVTRHK